MAEKKTKKEKIIGIDLGTSNSACAILQAGKPTIVPSAEGTTQYGKAFPSVVAFTKDGQLLVGEPARRQAVSNPQATITAAKRKMGTEFKYKIHGKEYTPQQISAFILQKVKKDAEEFIGESVQKAVIQHQLTLTTTKGRQQRTQAQSQAWKLSESLMSQQLLAWLMGWLKQTKR